MGCLGQRPPQRSFEHSRNQGSLVFTSLWVMRGMESGIPSGVVPAHGHMYCLDMNSGVPRWMKVSCTLTPHFGDLPGENRLVDLES